MPVYGLLLRWLTPRVAGVVTAVFYAALVIAVLLLLPVESAPFHYGRY